MNLPPRAEREAEGSWSTYHLERSERLRNLGQSTTSSEARGIGIFINFSPRARLEFRGSIQNLCPLANKAFFYSRNRFFQTSKTNFCSPCYKISIEYFNLRNERKIFIEFEFLIMKDFMASLK